MNILYLSIITIVGIVMTVSLLGNQIFADNTHSSMATIHVQVDKSNPDKPQIMITGTVYKLFSANLVIVISDPFNQKLAISQLTPSTDGHFSETLFAAGPLWSKSGNYSVSVVSSSQQLGQAKFYYAGTKPCCITVNPLHIDPPLKQFKSGISAKDIKCASGLQIVIKAGNHFPACVKPEDVSTLVERGWADKPNSLQEQLDLANSCTGLNEACKHRFDSKDVTKSQTTGSVKSSESFMSCNTSFPKNVTGMAVLYMPTNSTGKICVQYSNSNSPQPAGLRIFEARHIEKDTTDVTSYATPDKIQTGNSTIVYTVIARNHVGFYGLTIFCVGMPFAVGYDANSTFVEGDFPWSGGPYFCPAQSYEYHIVGLSGIGVKYIPYR